MKRLRPLSLLCLALILLGMIPAVAGAPLRHDTRREAITAQNISALAEIARFEHGRTGVIAVAVSPDGQQVATGAADGVIRLWDASGANPDPLRVWDAHALEIFALAFSPDGEHLASAGWDGWVRVWGLASANTDPKVRRLIGEPVYSLAYSPNGLWLASGSGYAANELRVWEFSTMSPALVIPRRHYDAVTDIAFSADSAVVMSASTDGSIREWTLDEAEPFRVLSGHAAPLSSAQFSPDGSVIASSGLDGTIRLWDATNGEPLRVIRTGYVSQITYSPDGSLIAAVVSEGQVSFWSPESGELFNTIQAHAPWVNSIAFSPDGSRFVTTGDDGTAKLWAIHGETSAAPAAVSVDAAPPPAAAYEALAIAQMQDAALKVHLHNTRTMGDVTVWAGGTLGEYTDYAPTWPVFSMLPGSDLPGVSDDYAGFNLNEFERPTLVNFWASWCGPCVQEFPPLTLIATQPEKYPYDVVFVNTWDEKGPALAFLFNQPAGLQVAVDAEGALLNALGSAAIPTSVLLDADHRVIAMHVGNFTSAQAALFAQIAQHPDLYPAAFDPAALPEPDHLVEIGSPDLDGAERFAPGDRPQGELSDERWWAAYQFEGQAGQVVTVRMDALSVRTQVYTLEPYVILLTPDGRYLVESSDYLYEPFAQVQNITLPEDGLYTVIATRYMGAEGISQGEFRLRLTAQ